MNREGMEIARGFKDAAIIENLRRAKKTAQAIQRNAIGEFIRFHDKIFAISEIESAELISPREPSDIRDMHFYNVEIRLKARGDLPGARHSFDKCSKAEFDTFAEKLGA